MKDSSFTKQNEAKLLLAKAGLRADVTGAGHKFHPHNSSMWNINVISLARKQKSVVYLWLWL